MKSVPRATDALGGRIPLLDIGDLSADQRELHERVLTTYAAAARSAGYRAALEDGRLIGPFNGFLRVPALSRLLLDQVDAISGAGLPFDIREVVILTVVAELGTAFPVYAHDAAARSAGIDGAAVTAIAARRRPEGLTTEQNVGYRLALALVRDRAVPDELYQDAVAVFGLAEALSYVLLAGQYLTIGALSTFLQIPAPGANDI